MKTILITGCSSGIGYYCAQQLQQHGWQVIASCRKAADVTRLQQQGFTCIQLDLADQSNIDCGWQQALALAKGNQLDALFNNAAYGQCGALEDLPTDALRRQFDSNFFGWHHLTRLAVAHMLEQGQGRIIQNSSILGLVAMKYRGAYNASKFAIEGYTDTLRLELSDTPIHISLIEPGPIESQFRANAKTMFLSTIQPRDSRHAEAYKATLMRLSSTHSNNKFTLGPEAVHRCLIHALQASHPKARYYVTFPTYLFAYLKRLLPSRWLDKLLIKG